MFFFTLFIFSFLLFTFVSAQGQQPQPTEFFGVDLTVKKIADIITGFACWLISIVLVIMVIALVISGIRFFLARGNETALTNAKRNITWTLVGILVILAANVIIATVANALGADYSFLPLNCGPLGGGQGTLTTCQNDSECVSKIGSGWECAISQGEQQGVCVRIP